MTYPDPMPNRLKSWTVTIPEGKITVQAFSIEYTRNHVVFKTWQGVTYRAFRSEDVFYVALEQ